MNVVPAVRSIYRWQGGVQEDAESLLIAKTRAALQKFITLRAPGTLVDDLAGHPGHVAGVVEAAELAIELPQPAVVAHPVGAEVDEPGFAHPAVVEAMKAYSRV